jgi:hypothetical protein
MLNVLHYLLKKKPIMGTKYKNLKSQNYIQVSL